MQLQKINSRTLESFLGHRRYRAYLEKLIAETSILLEEARGVEFLISRAENSDHGAFTDLSAWNVVAYIASVPAGWCIVVEDSLGIPKKEVPRVPTIGGGNTHNYRSCICDSCRKYRTQLDAVNESSTQ